MARSVVTDKCQMSDALQTMHAVALCKEMKWTCKFRGIGEAIPRQKPNDECTFSCLHVSHARYSCARAGPLEGMRNLESIAAVHHAPTEKDLCRD